MRRPGTASPALPSPAPVEKSTEKPAQLASAGEGAQIAATPLAAGQVTDQMNGASPKVTGVSPGMTEIQELLAARRQELTQQVVSPGKAAIPIKRDADFQSTALSLMS